MRIVILKKEQNGEHSLNNSVAIIGIIIMLLLALIPTVVAYGTLNEKVGSLERQYETIDGLEVRIRSLENIASGTEVALVSIQSDVQEIKIDVKELRKEFQSQS